MSAPIRFDASMQSVRRAFVIALLAVGLHLLFHTPYGRVMGMVVIGLGALLALLALVGMGPGSMEPWRYRVVIAALRLSVGLCVGQMLIQQRVSVLLWTLPQLVIVALLRMVTHDVARAAEVLRPPVELGS